MTSAGGTAAPVPFLDVPGVNGPLRERFDAVWSEVCSHGRYVGGPEVERFEDEFAAYCETDYCVGVANGTDALELILAALDVGPGDEVILPTNTFVATVEAVCAVGATPVLVDVEPGTLQISADAVADAVGAATVAVIAVHLFGQMVDLGRLQPVIERHGLALIEDAAQAHGARFDGRVAGSVGIAAGFSFYPGKNLGALGDAGAVTTADPVLADRVRRLADHGRTAADRLVSDLSGRNSRLDSVQAGVLSVKLGQLDEANVRRREAMSWYRELLPSGCAPLAEHPDAEAVYHLGVVQVDDRQALGVAFDGQQVGWGIHYPVPCHLQPAYAQAADERDRSIAERAAGRIVSLPMSPTLTRQQVQRVCEVAAGVTEQLGVPG